MNLVKFWHKCEISIITDIKVLKEVSLKKWLDLFVHWISVKYVPLKPWSLLFAGILLLEMLTPDWEAQTKIHWSQCTLHHSLALLLLLVMLSCVMHPVILSVDRYTIQCCQRYSTHVYPFEYNQYWVKTQYLPTFELKWRSCFNPNSAGLFWPYWVLDSLQPRDPF